MSGMKRSARSIRQAGRGKAASLVALVLVGSLAAGCGASHKRLGATTPGTAGGASAGLSGSTTTSTTVAAPASAGGSRSGGSPTTTAPRSSGASTGAVSGSGSSTASSGAPRPATPGTYTFDQSGGVTATGFSSSEPPQGTLVVDPAQSDGVQAWHRYVDPKNQPADTNTQFRSNGPFILSATEASPQGNTSCTFNPALAAPPWPPVAGATASAVGNCGSFTVSVQERITGTQNVTLKDGETFAVWVIDSTLNISGQVTGSGTQVDWYSPAIRLPVHEQVDINGNYNGLGFQLHSVSDLVSSHPT